MGTDVDQKRRTGLAIVAAALLLVLVAYVDYVTGVELGFSIFYLLPTCLITWYLGLRPGIAAALFCSLVWLALDTDLWQRRYELPTAPYWNTLVRFSFFVIVASLQSKLHTSLETVHRSHDELTAAYVELDRVRKEQLTLKDALLSHVSHELRTPLTAVHQFVTLVADGVAGEITADQKEYLGVAVRNINQLNRMISDLLDSTRSDVGKLRFEPLPTHLISVVEDILRTLRSPAAEKEVDLVAEVPPDLPRVIVDPARLRQVLINLLDNAVKFTPPGGTVTVGARASTDEPGFLEVSVADTGSGIPEEDQARIFQRLEQAAQGDTTRKGLGLGLYISREIIVRQGGRIWVTSRPGRGSIFWFTIPVLRENPEDGGVE